MKLNQAIRTVLCLTNLFLAGCASSPAKAVEPFIPCQQDKERLALRSKELADIEHADQEDRKNFQSMTPEQMMEMSRRDELRRKRVGEIFGEGCFSKAQDFASAAIVYQHGNAPEHFLQTFLWAKRAVELGDLKQKRLMALGIDRYLVNIGHMQLFGSQANKAHSDICYCMQQVEKSFTDNLREQYAKQTLKEAFRWIKELNQGKSCPNKECTTVLKPTPKGTVPGFW